MADLARVALLLDALAESRGGLSVTELAARTGVPRSAVHRVLQRLEHELYVVRSTDPERPGYELGPGLMKYGLNSYMRLLAANRPSLVALARTVRERVELAIFSGREVVVVDQIGSPARLRGVTRVGRSFSLHASCIGKALLARLPDEQVRELLPNRLVRFTGETVTDRAELLAELDHVRRGGIALDRDEHDVGISAVATAWIGPTGASQAVAVVMPSHAFTAKYADAVRGLHGLNPAIDLPLTAHLPRSRY